MKVLHYELQQKLRTAFTNLKIDRCVREDWGPTKSEKDTSVCTLLAMTIKFNDNNVSELRPSTAYLDNTLR